MPRSVLVIGSGAREHALAWVCSRSAGASIVYCAPGNAGTAEVATNVPIADTDVEQLVRFGQDEHISLAVIGTDAAVAAGVGDGFLAAGIPVFGPTARAGRIESSKEFAKTVMNRAGIPTARWRACGSLAEGMEFVTALGGRCVVKADGLALGKGVVVCDDAIQAGTALRACFEEGRFGAAGERVVVEERLEGPEVSIFAISDGVHTRMLGAACDYKRAGDGDEGPMTGGMGTYTPPAGLDNEKFLTDALAIVIDPCIDALRSAGSPFVGCLYAGVMLTEQGIRVIEYNARFGDPEAQALLPLVADDLVEVFDSAARGTLAPGRIAMSPGASVTVVAAAAGYPGTPRAGGRISGVDRLDPGVQCFHSGTGRDGEGALVATGGRVLSITAQAENVDSARARAYANLDRVTFDGMWSRRDIALQPAKLPR